MPTAAVVIIGNEILTGKFQDENGPYAIQRFRALGCDLGRVVVIADEREEIAREVAFCAERYDHVVTSGGVGPTHDDVTFSGVAEAFGVALEPHQELMALLSRFQLPQNDATRQMAMLPQGAEVFFAPETSFPVVLVRNVVVLPGVPKLFRRKFEEVSARFTGVSVSATRLYTRQHEWEFAAQLQAVAERYPSVSIGSYPRFEDSGFYVMIALEGRNSEHLTAAVRDLQESLELFEPATTL